MKRGAMFVTATFVALLFVLGSSALDQSQVSSSAPSFVVSAASRDYSTMPEIGVSSVRVFNPLQLSEVEESSDLIVLGILHDDAKESLDVQTQGEYTYVAYGCTVSTLEITKIYQGNAQIGDLLPFAEPFYIQSSEGVDSIVHRDAYLPSVPGKEYLFMLRFVETYGTVNDVYYARGAELGRYPVLSPRQRDTVDLESIPDRQLDISEREGGLYKQFYQEAIDKYMTD